MAKFLKLDPEQVEKDALGAARLAARRLQAVIAIKGASTHVVSPQREALLNNRGTIGLATSGSRDTLAGILTSFRHFRSTREMLRFFRAFAPGRVGPQGDYLCELVVEHFPQNIRVWEFRVQTRF